MKRGAGILERKMNFHTDLLKKQRLKKSRCFHGGGVLLILNSASLSIVYRIPNRLSRERTRRGF